MPASSAAGEMSAHRSADTSSRPSETLLPDTTQGFFAISNVDGWSEHFNRTQIGHLMAEPVMQPFVKDFQRQIEERWSSVRDRLGLSLQDLKGVPGGDVGIGLVEPARGRAAIAIVADVAGRVPHAREMLQRVIATQLKRGAKKSEIMVRGCPDPVIQFDLPEPEDEKDAGRSPQADDGDQEASADARQADPAATGRGSHSASPERLAFYCLTGNLLVVTDDRGVLEGILGRAMGNHSRGSLAEHQPFQMVMNRCWADYGKGEMPQMRWFIHPLGYAEASRAATPENRRRKGKTILEVMRHQGVEAVRGIGGFADFDSEECELVHRTAVYAPRPYREAMKMAVLPNREDFTPQPWVPRDIATYTTLYFDVLNGFDNFGPLFDELVGGEPGSWQDSLDSLKTDPKGPMIDLREELIKHLGQRVSMLSDYQLPITTTSERLLFAIEAKNPKAVAAGIEKLFKNDKSYKRREKAGHVIWEMVEEEAPDIAAPTVDLGTDAAGGAPSRPLAKNRKNAEGKEEKPLLPHAAVTVCEGNLMIASHIDFLLKVIAPEKKPEPLVKEADYLQVDAEIGAFEPTAKCFRFFSRTDEEYRTTYELVRQNKMPQSETMLARVLNGLFGEGKKGETRKQQIDGRTLPDYNVVRRYLGPAGMQMTSERDGWFLKGFTLTK